jgi:hypothetical protein
VRAKIASPGMDETKKSAPSAAGSEAGPGQLRSFIEALKQETGGDADLLRQVYADNQAWLRQSTRNHFESRQEYVRHMAEIDKEAQRGIVEYGLQTLKWSFLLNAGAIAIVVAYVGGALAKSSAPNSLSSFAPLIKALWPFAAGCVMVTLAGAAGFFNFSYGSASLPSPEALHNFMAPTSQAWPMGKVQLQTEAPPDFYKRFVWKVGFTRKIAIALAIGSALSFVYGLYRVFHVVLS